MVDATKSATAAKSVKTEAKGGDGKIYGMRVMVVASKSPIPANSSPVTSEKDKQEAA
jgi:hypothetical protein